MKNGEPRSAAWIKRAMKTWKRDNKATQTLLSLVSIEPIPSLDEIRTWADEQCMLAEDWAGAVHLRASDNINRVPAMPKHLKPYQRRYPPRSSKAVAIEAVKEMAGDNGTCFHPTDSQWGPSHRGASSACKRLAASSPTPRSRSGPPVSTARRSPTSSATTDSTRRKGPCRASSKTPGTNEQDPRRAAPVPAAP